MLWVDASFYSPQTQLTTWMRLSFVAGLPGSVHVTTDFQTVSSSSIFFSERLPDFWELLVLHCLCALGYLYYFAIEVSELRELGGRKYFRSLMVRKGRKMSECRHNTPAPCRINRLSRHSQNWFQIVNLSLFFVGWILRLITWSVRPAPHTLDFLASDEFFDFRPAVKSILYCHQMQAINVSRV